VEASRAPSESEPAVDLEGPALALRAAIERAATIVVASEPLPDGDAFGAELALRAFVEATFGLALRRDGARPGAGPKYVALLSEHGGPERYSFLEGAGDARAPDEQDRALGFDLGIVVDGGVERCGHLVRPIIERCRERAYIDHHRQGSRARYDVVVLDPRRAATTELLAALLDTEAWRSVPLSRGLAEAIYAGLVSDTGSFAYSLTTPGTHRLAARLLEAGVRTTLIHERAMLDTDLEDLKLAGRVFAALEMELSGKLLVGVVPLAYLHGRHQHGIAFDRIVTPMAFVKGAQVTLLLRELDHGHWKVSLRSRGAVDVAAVARSLDAEGGGHARAAGCTLRGELAQVRERCIASIRTRLA
jgi:phosphoesterase RecJ-like protein